MYIELRIDGKVLYLTLGFMCALELNALHEFIQLPYRRKFIIFAPSSRCFLESKENLKEANWPLELWQAALLSMISFSKKLALLWYERFEVRLTASHMTLSILRGALLHSSPHLDGKGLNGDDRNKKIILLSHMYRYTYTLHIHDIIGDIVDCNP